MYIWSDDSNTEITQQVQVIISEPWHTDNKMDINREESETVGGGDKRRKKQKNKIKSESVI